MKLHDDKISHRRSDNDIVKQQVSHFISLLEEYSSKRPSPRSREDYDYLRDFFPRLIDDHNVRIVEVESREYKKALQLAQQQFPHKPFWILCMDGRVLTILMYGGSAHIDDSIRVPGGILREFVRGKDAKFKLQEDSVYAQLLKRALDNSPTDAIAEIFDSHIGCAARKAEEGSRGKYPEDSGLLTDVLHKKQMIDAAERFVEEEYRGMKRLFPIQTSFDPHTGFLYMGLETDSAFRYAVDSSRVYTEEVLRALVKEGKILSAESIADDPKMKKIFNKYDFDLAWKTHYVESAMKFWEAIAAMKRDVLPLIEEKVKAVFPNLRDTNNKDATDQLALRSILLLTNTFSGFLQNKHPEGEPVHNGDSHSKFHHRYAYGIHEEEGIKLTEGGYPPHKISMFTVFSLIENKLPGNMELAAMLVRSNRMDGRIEDHSGNFPDKKEFTKAPVPVVMLELVRDGRLTEADWKALEEIDWFDLVEMDWDHMTYEEFDNYIEAKGKLAQPIANAIIKLKRKMGVIFDAQRTISHHLVNHDQVILPLLMDHTRKIRCLIPFVKLGFN